MKYSEKLNWSYCQEISDVILADGINTLKIGNKFSFSEVQNKSYGNYLISHASKPYYIGEAKNLKVRIKQHSRENTSTFYKNYLKQPQLDYSILEIDDFNVQILETSIGRKEIEEFGIVNLPTNLNKFQKGKRKRFTGNTNQGIWDRIQDESEKLITEGEEDLLNIEPAPWYDAEVPNNAGIYYVENVKDGLIYIGESSNIYKRYVTHSGVTYFSVLRRHIGTDILGFELHVRKGKKRYFFDHEDDQINQYLQKCTIKAMAVNFGRFELEEFLIRKHRPLLNRKENK